MSFVLAVILVTVLSTLFGGIVGAIGGAAELDRFMFRKRWWGVGDFDKKTKAQRCAAITSGLRIGREEIDELKRDLEIEERKLAGLLTIAILATTAAAAAATIAAILGWTPAGGVLAAAAVVAGLEAGRAWAAYGYVRTKVDQGNELLKKYEEYMQNLRDLFDENECNKVGDRDRGTGSEPGPGQVTPNPGGPTDPRRPEDGREP
ncbi:MAG: hypothetical protein AAGP08_18900 [Pseudomonadota bacterium]